MWHFVDFMTPCLPALIPSGAISNASCQGETMRFPALENSPEMPEPAWDVALLFVRQGAWSEEEWLNLPGNRLSEFDRGRIAVLDLPSERHRSLVAFLCRAIGDFAGIDSGPDELFAVEGCL
jgi:hypothetical protein